MKQGVWKTFDKENRLVKIQNYKNNKLNGTSISFYDDGFVSSFGNYHDDKPHGPIILYFSDGLINNYENYLYGIKEGFSYLYFRNGSIQSKWFYKSGKKDGEQIEFNEQKDTVRIDVFKNGILLRTEHK
ncbi:MAG: hypothetical protein Q8K02_11965 [Flavobacterium sp.]|nr:hypothetical protein [Flavobacterium sp.]